MAKLKNYQIAVDGSADFAAPRRKRNPAHWWKYLLTFIAGQLSLLIVLVVGVSVLATSFNAGTILSWIGQDGLLTDNYSSKSLLGIALGFMDTNEPIEINCVNDVFQIFTQEKAEELLHLSGDDGLFKTLETKLGITFPTTGEDSIYLVNFEDMPQYLEEHIYPANVFTAVMNQDSSDSGEGDSTEFYKGGILDDSVLVTFDEEGDKGGDTGATGEGGEEGGSSSGGFSLDVTQAPLKVLFYYEDAETGEWLPYNLSGFLEFLPTITDLTVGELMGIDVDDPDTAEIMKAFAGMTISDLISGNLEIDSLLKGMQLKDILGSQTGILALLEDAYISKPDDATSDMKDIAETIDGLKVGAFLGYDDDNPAPAGLMKYISDLTISSLGDGINDMRVGDVVGETNNSLLKALSECYITDLETGVNGLVFTDLFGDTIFNTDNTDPENPVHTFKTKADGGNPVWKYLLKDATHTTDEECWQNASNTSLLNGMNGLMNNMTANMQTATIGELNEDGLISVSSEDLEKRFLVDGDYVAMKDMTLSELISTVAAFGV